METGKIKTYNTHNVRIKFGRASEQQLRRCLNGFLNLLSKKFPEKNYHKCQIDINIVYENDRETNQPKSRGTGFLWVENPEVYYIMCGFNPDGTDRYLSSKNSPLQKDKSLKFLEMSFLEILDYDKSEGDEIKTKLPSIVEIPSFRRTPEDAEEAYQYALQEYIRECEANGTTPNPDHEKLRSDALIGHIQVARAESAILKDPRQVPNILRGEVADWVKEDDIKEKFIKFNSRGTMKITSKPTKNGNKEFKITYDNASDGSFAFQMNRRSYFLNPETNKMECFTFDFFKNFNSQIPIGNGPEKSKNGFVKNNSFLNRNNDNGFLNRNSGFKR